MANIGAWNKSLPSDTSQVRDFPTLYQSDKSAFQTGFQDEHYWVDGSADSAGIHKPGSAAPYEGLASSVSTVGKPGMWLMIATDTYEIFGLSSTSTLRLSGGFNPDAVAWLL